VLLLFRHIVCVLLIVPQPLSYTNKEDIKLHHYKMPKPPKLQTIPLDMLLTIGKFLQPVEDSHMTDINQITLAAVLNDREMLEYLIERHDDDYEKEITPAVALSGNLKILKWTINQLCDVNEHTCQNAAGSGNLEMVKYLHGQGYPWYTWSSYGAATLKPEIFV
jgi:hypothetical protein